MTAHTSPHTIQQLVASLASLVRATHAVLPYMTPVHPAIDRDVNPILFGLRRGPSTVGEIADDAHIDISTASRHITALVEHHLVTKVPDPNDRRVQRITLTDHGHAMLEKAIATRVAWVQEATHDWSDADILTAAEGCQRLAADMLTHLSVTKERLSAN